MVSPDTGPQDFSLADTDNQHHVTFICDYMNPRLGMQKATDELIGLLNRDLAIEVVTVSGELGSSQDESVGILPLNRASGLIGRILAVPDLRRVARTRPDNLFITVGIWAAVTFLIATLGLRRRVVLWEHSLLRARIGKDRKLAVAAILLRLLSWRLSAVVSVSRAGLAAITPFVWPLNKLFYIPNLQPTRLDVGDAADNRSRDADPTSAVRLIGLGSLTSVKNWRLAISAMQYLPESVSLSIAGDGPMQASLAEQITHLKLEDRVELLGYVDNGGSLFSDYDVVVHPSLSETFGYTLIEAAVAERAVVVLPRETMDSLVPNYVCGIVAEDESAESFASAIRRTVGSKFDYSIAAARRASEMSDSAVRGAWLVLVQSSNEGRTTA